MATVLFLGCLAPVQMNAQSDENSSTSTKRERPNPTQMVEQRVKEMTTKYSLNTTQQKQLKELFTTQMQNRGGMKGGHKGFRNMTETQRDSMKTAMKAEREKFDISLKKILTTEQYTQYTKDEKARREKMMKNKPQDGPGEGPGQGQGPEE